MTFALIALYSHAEKTSTVIFTWIGQTTNCRRRMPSGVGVNPLRISWIFAVAVFSSLLQAHSELHHILSGPSMSIPKIVL